VAQSGGEYNIRNRQELHELQIAGTKVWKGQFDNLQWPSRTDEFRNLIALPLTNRDKTFGVIKAENKIPQYGNHFSDEDLLIFKTIANVIVLALENESLHRRAEEQSKRVSVALDDIIGAVVGHYDMKVLLDQIINTMMRILQAEVCSIFLEDKDKEPGVLTCVAGSGFARNIVGIAKYRVGEGFTGSVLKYGGEYNIKSLDELQNIKIDGLKVWKGSFDDYQWSSHRNEFRNLLALPLRIKGGSFGVIKVENKIDGDSFSDADETIFRIIANVIALTIEKTKLQSRIENQLKSISGMAGHRIHNLLTFYDGISFKLKSLYRFESVRKDSIISIEEELAEATSNIKRLVKEFRKYGKPIELKRINCNINEIILNTIRKTRRSSEISIIPNLAPDIPYIAIDETRFSESMHELITNAVRIIGKGKIWISTNMLSADRGHLKSILIRIKDDGPGFEPGFKVFEPFHSTNPTRTGL